MVLVELHGRKVRPTWIHGDDGFRGDPWYLFWRDDCFDPPLALVRGEAFGRSHEDAGLESAYDVFTEYHSGYHGDDGPETDIRDYIVDTLRDDGMTYPEAIDAAAAFAPGSDRWDGAVEYLMGCGMLCYNDGGTPYRGEDICFVGPVKVHWFASPDELG